MRVVAHILNIIDHVSLLFGQISSVLVWGMIVVVTIEVVSRYFLNNPTTWGNQTIIFLFGTYGLILGCYSLLTKAHVNVDIIYGKFSPRGQAILDLLTSPMFFAFVIVLIWQGWDFGFTALRQGERVSDFWDPPVGWFKMMIPFGATLLGMQGLAKLIRDFYIAIHGHMMNEISTFKSTKKSEGIEL